MLLGYKSSLYICSLRRFNWKFRWGNHLNTQNRSTTMSKKVVKWTSWWFQPIWKILVNLDHSARQGKNNETTTWRHFFQLKFAETVLSLSFNMCRWTYWKKPRAEKMRAINKAMLNFTGVFRKRPLTTDTRWTEKCFLHIHILFSCCFYGFLALEQVFWSDKNS